MPDYVKCTNKECSRKNECARYLMIPGKNQKHWWFNEDTCGNFVRPEDVDWPCEEGGGK